MNSDSSESDLVIVTNKDRFKRYLRIYKRTIFSMFTPLIFMPIAFIGQNNAYKSFYIFLVTAAFFVGNVLQPGVTSLLPIVMFTIMEAFNFRVINTINISNSVVDCFSMMAVILAVEHSNIHKRAALKILMTFGCSHFRLSFIIFMTTTLLSLWVSNCMACGLMMPLVKAILKELEKMGVLETTEMIGKTSAYSSDGNEKSIPRPSDFTVFYFIGVAYSSTIGGMATFIGSETNQIFINYCAAIFPNGPKLESPRYLLLALPSVIVMEIFLYLWLNFYYLGMLRVRNYTALQASLTNDEEQFISVMLNEQYQQMGVVTFHEMIVGVTVLVGAILQGMIYTATSHTDEDKFNTRRFMNTFVPSVISVFILFVAPTNLTCLKFLKKQNDKSEPLPTFPNKGCLTWNMVKYNVDWSVVFLTASVNVIFDSLEDTKMTDEFEKFLSLFSECHVLVQACVVIAFCKMLTEFASNPTVERCMLRHIANVGIKCKVNPLYLMLSATLSISLPFHLVTGGPAYAMVSSYVHIPPRKLMTTGIGPSVMGILMNMFTVCVWFKVIWPDIDAYVFTDVTQNK